MDPMQTSRQFLKPKQWSDWANLERDQEKGVPPPPLQKPAPEGAKLINLVAPDDLTVGAMPLIVAINRRRTRRQFTQEPLTLEELSFLLRATQGVHEIWRDGSATRRTVPAPGSRHPFETYLLVYRVADLEPGLYRYLALDHKLCYLRPVAELAAAAEQYARKNAAVVESGLYRYLALDHKLRYLRPEAELGAAAERDARRDAAVVFIWTAVPYRTEWRYNILAHKMIAQASGHVCQNLYLACEAIGAGTCARAAYFQDEVDALVGVDGADEFTVYMAPVGKVG